MTTFEKIKGAIYGFALGDALGLGTEFMTRNEIQSYYPSGLRNFDDFVRDAHRSQWDRACWTNDTIMFTTLADSIIRRGTYDLPEFAKDFHKMLHSLECDISPVLRAIINTPGWEEAPVRKAAEAWKRFGLFEASNDAVHRGVLAGLLAPAGEVDNWARSLTLITNPDSRCVSSTMVVARMTNSLLHKETPAPYDSLVEVCYAVDARTIPYLDHAFNGPIEDLDLDDEQTLAYTRKAMTAGIWPILHCDNAADCIYCIVDQGGDADTNAALAGAFAGLLYGYDALPDLKNELEGRELLDSLAERMTAHVEKISI